MSARDRDVRKDSGSWGRLAHISGHFLSDALPPHSVDKGQIILPVLMDRHDDIPIVQRLCLALIAEGCRALVLHIGRQYVQSISDGNAPDALHHGVHVPLTRESDWTHRDTLLEHMTEELGATLYMTDLFLLPLTVVHPDILRLAAKALLLIPATDEGVRRAYLRVKKCLHAGANPAFVAIMTESDGHGAGLEHAERLSTGAQYFLRHPVTCCGHLPAMQSASSVQTRPDLDPHRKVMREVLGHVLQAKRRPRIHAEIVAGLGLP